MGYEAEQPKVTRRKRYEPTDKDYQLSRVSFDEAENGVVVNCSYRLKDEVQSKIEKQRSEGGPYISSYRDDVKHVFQDKSEARKFIDSELSTMWTEKAAEEAHEDETGTQE